jgi:hypothetical protein
MIESEGRAKPVFTGHTSVQASKPSQWVYTGNWIAST